jgi:acetyl-CoA synthetase
MLEKFVEQTTFVSEEDFIKNFKVKVPENFNFGYDVVDEWARIEPNKIALCWTNDQGEHIDFSFADMKNYTDMTASYFQSLGIGQGDMVMLILKRRYEFWFSIIATPQTWCRSHSGYTSAHKERYRLPRQRSKHQDDRLRR